MEPNQITRPERRKQRLNEPVGKRALGAFAFSCWLVICSWFGFGVVSFAARPYTVLQPMTWVSWLFFGILACTLIALVYVKFRGYFGYAVSVVIGIAATLAMFFLLLGPLMPMHYRKVCDTMDAMWACERATSRLRENCKPGLACFPRLEKACRLGSRNACLALIKGNHSSEEKICAILSKSCATHNACAKSSPPECRKPYFPDVKPYRFACESHQEICEPEPLPAAD